MVQAALEIASSFILSIIDSSGYAGIFFLMTLESAAIPIPSEIIMPFSGFLAAEGNLLFFVAVFTGTLGNLAGSLILYAVGYYGGRHFVVRYGRYIFFSERHLLTAERWFVRFGGLAAFFGRMLPIVRTYISFPAGFARMDMRKFILYTVAGSFVWSLFLTWVGFILGERWKEIETYARKFDILIGATLITGIVYGIWFHIKKRKNSL
ncbi:MAG: DedA family protein [Candidatus Niyogibacteria bacterium]|nr:DedA family protein [Candidatus Niyogibacteria bacterium]